MGVEACDDCGGQVGDSAETCPHCGSNANHLRRLRPLQEEEAEKKRQEEEVKKKEQEAKEKKVKKGCLIFLILVIVLVVLIVVGVSRSDTEEFDRCLGIEIMHGASSWDAAKACSHLND